MSLVRIRESDDTNAAAIAAVAAACDDIDSDHELGRLLEYARKVRGRRDVHSVYEVLDWLAAIQREALAVAECDWRTSVSESEHYYRIAKMERLRGALGVERK